MSEWKTYRLEDITIEIGDGLHGTPQYSIDGEYYFINGNNIVDGNILLKPDTKRVSEEEYDKYKKMLSDRTILLSINGTIGNVGFYRGEKCILGKSACYLTIKDDVDKSFVYYFLKTKVFQNHLFQIATGTTILNVPIKGLRETKISLPSLPEQKRIAGILSALDDKIELNRRINANLEAQAMALYKHWFVDFEPWNGVMPHDWREGCIADIVELLNGFAFKSSDFDENGHYRLITIKGVQDGKMSTEGADKLSTIPPQMPEWCLLQKGDILLSLTGNVGRCCLVDENNCLLNQRVAKIRPKNDYNKLFSYIMFRQNEMKARLISIARGTAQMNLSPIETGKQPILVPPEVVLKDFGGKYNHIIDSILLNIEESSCLTSLRNTLLPKLMNNNI